MGDMTNFSWLGSPINLTALFKEFEHHGMNLTYDLKEGPPAMIRKKDDFREILGILGTYYTPVLVPVGVLCNIVCVFILLSTSFKKISCTCYVAAMTLCNSTFLLTFFLIWLSKYNVQAYNTPGLCQLLTLLSCTSNFLSCWYAVFLAIDRYILLFHQRLITLCTTISAKIFIIVAAAFAIAIHINVSLTVDVQAIPGQGHLCLPLSIHMEALNVLGKVDVFFNVIFAYLLLITLSIVNWVGLIRHTRSKKPKRAGNKHKLDIMFTRAANIFLTFFLCLCAPSQMIRIYCTIRELMGNQKPNHYLYSIQQLLQYPYYTGFALGSVVYIISLTAARTALKSACLKLYRRTKSFRRRRRPVNSLASHTIVTMAEITNLKNVSLL